MRGEYVSSILAAKVKRLFCVVAALLVLGLDCGLSSKAWAISTNEAAAPNEGIKVGDSSVDKRHVIVVSVPGLSFMEVTPDALGSLPAWHKLFHSGQIGAMNVRMPWRGQESVYATWGAGQPADGRGGAGWNRGERLDGQSAAAMMERYGFTMAGNPQVIVPEIGKLRQRNAENHYLAQPGRLGSILMSKGIQVGVWGNLDDAGTTAETHRRPVFLMGMDERGAVRYGEAGKSIYQADSKSPFGMHTRYDLLVKQSGVMLEESSGSGALAVMELGDLYRLYLERDRYSEGLFAQKKQEIMADMDDFLGKLMKSAENAGENTVIWIVSPGVHAEAAEEKLLLTPLLRWNGTGSGTSALLHSGTTRREGVVAAVDLTPSLLAEFGIGKPETMTGQAMDSKAVGGDVLTGLWHEMQRISRVYKLRPPLLYSLAVFEMAVMLLGLLIAWNKSRGNVTSMREGWTRKASGLLYSVLLIPAGLLVAGWMPDAGAFISVALLILYLAAGGMAFTWRKRGSYGVFSCFGWAGAGTVLLMILDRFIGGLGMRYSVLSYDPMIGARYYGVGNEFMGVLLGAAILGFSALLELRRPAAGARAAAGAALLGAGLCAYLAAPALGAEAGGALAGAAAFGALAARLNRGGGLPLRRLSLALALPVGAALAGLWLLNAAWTSGSAGGPSSAAATGAPAALAVSAGAVPSGPSSHIGRAFQDLRQGRYDEIGAIIMRKLQMNVHLIRVSAWSKVLLTGLIVMAFLVLRPKGRFRRWEERYPYFMHGCFANVIGAFAALALNDSGIVAAATMIVFSSVPLLLLSLQEQA